MISRSKLVADQSKSEKGLVSLFPRTCSRMPIKGGIRGTLSPINLRCFLNDDSMSPVILTFASRAF